jgi:hypothetical protein
MQVNSMKIQPVNEGLALSFFRHQRLFEAIARRNYAAWQHDGATQTYYVTDESGNTHEVMTGPPAGSFDAYWQCEMARVYQHWTACCLGNLRRRGLERHTLN